MEVKIDNDKPIPPGRETRPKWPWAEMGIGDSFFAAGYSLTPQSGMLRFSVSNGRLHVPGSKWSTRTVTENGVKGVRVWRVA